MLKDHDMMSRKSVSGLTHLVMVVTCLLLASPSGWAQQASGLAGQVQDASGAVLPGVTVEASSPALIEKVRTVITDGQGRYSVVSLPAGTFSVIFTLPGFKTVLREGIELTYGFTATVNADLTVGGLEETITVTGASPIVDTSGVKTQTLVSNELLNTLPSASATLNTVFKVTPGLVTTNASGRDVGGAAGSFWGNSMSGTFFHGKRNARILVDGLVVNDFVTAFAPATAIRTEQSMYFVNMTTIQETAFESSGVSAENGGGGITMNSIPRSGSNAFAFRAFGMYTNERMQAENLSDALRAQGVGNSSIISNMYSTNVAVGGAIKQDRLWFFTAPKRDHLGSDENGPYPYNKTQGTPFYTPDPTRPSDRTDQVYWLPARLTWQASPKDTLNFFTDYQSFCGCPTGATDAEAPEAEYMRKGKTRMVQGSWTRPVTNRLLLEAGGHVVSMRLDIRRRVQPAGVNDITDISITDTTTDIRYNQRQTLGLTGLGLKATDRYAQRFSGTYVTGSHNFKAGIIVDEGIRREGNLIPSSISYRFRGSTPGNATPLSLTLYATPYSNNANQKADLLLFAQDRWTMSRLSLSYGLQYEWLNSYVPAQEVAATRFVPARSFEKVENVPNFRDLNPRVGAAYDLFGNGRTAIRTSLSRYVVPVGVGLGISFNPLLTSVNSVTRTWNDIAFGAGDPRSGNYVPDCELTNPVANGECGPYQNLNFGRSRITTTWDPNLTQGFGVRDGLWEVTAEVQQQVTSGMSVTAGYYRNWFFGLRVIDNTLVTPADYSPYSVVAPVDPRLPGGGGYTVTGLYDLNPNKVGQVNSRVVAAPNFGNPSISNDFISLNVQTRLGGGYQVGGGLDTGRTVTDSCFVVDSPQALLDCHQVTSFGDQTQLKLFATAPLPAGFAVSGIYNDLPGLPITASYTVNSSQIVGLGRNLSTGTVAVPLITPGAEFDKRNRVIDVQLSRNFQVTGKYRLRPNIAIYNLLNAENLDTRVNTYGPLFGPNSIAPGRMIQLSGELSF